MTIAICILCGEQKLGAWTPCRACGFQPDNPLDKARSLTLTDHHYAYEQLVEFGKMIQRGDRPHFDFLTLRREADSIFESDYFFAHHDPQSNSIPCVQCGQAFTPEAEEIYCSQCIPISKRPLSVCSKCCKLFECRTKFCPDCGSALERRDNLTPNRVAGLLVTTLREAWVKGSIWNKSKHLPKTSHTLPEERFGPTEMELEIFALYTAFHVVRSRVPSSAIARCIVEQMIELHQGAWRLAGFDEVNILARITRIRDRFDEYDKSLERYPHSAELGLGNTASQSCLGIDGNIEVTLEMLLFFGYFSKVLGGQLGSAISSGAP